MILRFLKFILLRKQLKTIDKRGKKERGKIAEDFAAVYLELKGYRILKRNLFFKKGEIDILAEKNNVLFIFEVKFRSKDDFGRAEESVDFKKKNKLYKIAQNFNLKKYKNIELKLFFINVNEKRGINYGIIDF